MADTTNTKKKKSKYALSEDLEIYQADPVQRKAIPDPTIPSAESANSASPEELDSLATRLRKPAEPAPVAPVSSVELDKGGEVETPSPENVTPTVPAVNPAKPVEVLDRISRGNSTAPVDHSESRSLSKQLRELGAKYEAEFQGNVPPDLAATLRTAEEKASQLYQEKANRNEWLEVAQMLGRAGAQFAAAQAGMASGHNNANLSFGPGIDYEARTGRALREYENTVGTAAKEATLRDQMHGNRDKQIRSRYDSEYKPLKESLDNAEKRESEQESFRRDRERDNSAFERAQIVANRTNKREDERHDRWQTTQSLAELTREEKEVGAKAEAATALKNRLLAADDLDSKSLRKFNEQNPGLAAKAGLDLDGIAAEMDREEKEAGWFGGEEAKKGKKAALLAHIQPMINELKAIKARKQELLKGQGTLPPSQLSGNNQPPGSPPPAPPAPKQDPKVKAYADQYLKGNYEQAKAVLVKRGYAPQE